ncbi:hypothetical protein V8F33_013568 [Rhypophila sp. PSN 637]
MNFTFLLGWVCGVSVVRNLGLHLSSTGTLTSLVYLSFTCFQHYCPLGAVLFCIIPISFVFQLLLNINYDDMTDHFDFNGMPKPRRAVVEFLLDPVRLSNLSLIIVAYSLARLSGWPPTSLFLALSSSLSHCFRPSHPAAYGTGCQSRICLSKPLAWANSSKHSQTETPVFLPLPLEGRIFSAYRLWEPHSCISLDTNTHCMGFGKR